MNVQKATQKEIMRNQDYFLFFLRHKIDSGIKQIDIVRSTGISTAYVNKLYRRPPKNCAMEIQEKIAEFFGYTYEEMIYEAKQLYKDRYREAQEIKEIQRTKPIGSTLGSYQEQNERRVGEPTSLVNQLNCVSKHIQLNAAYTRSVEEQRNQLLDILNNVRTGFCVVDEKLDIVYQNPLHTKIFGSKTSQPYSYFWDEGLDSEEFYKKLKTGEYETIEAIYNKVPYRVELSLTYKGSEIIQIVEHVIPRKGHSKAKFSTLDDNDSSTHLYREILGKIIPNGVDYAFFSLDRALKLASSKMGGLIDKYDFPQERPTVDQLLLDLDDRDIENGREKIRKLREMYDNKEEDTLDMVMDGTHHTFTTKRIYSDKSLLGLLLIISTKE